MQVKFHGIDGFNRPVFKAVDRPEYYGSTSHLFDYDATEADVLETITADDLCYFGSRFNCEPYGTPATNLEIIKEQ